MKIELEEFILEEARAILLSRLKNAVGVIEQLEDVDQYLTLEYGLLDNEQFGCMFLNSNYSLINHKIMFKGTISHCETYPREIAREALLQNAVFVVLIHNHPSESVKPSRSDISMTKAIEKTLAAVDIVLFDHVIVGGGNTFSMRRQGILT